MKAKSVFIGIAILAAIMLLFSFSSVSNLWSASPGNLLAGVNSKPMAAKFLPKRSPLVTSFLVNPDRLARYIQINLPPNERRELSSEIARLKQTLRQQWLLDYDQDLRPWLDQEITLAVTSPDLDRNPENGWQPGYMLALASKDLPLTKSKIDQFWQTQAVNGIDLEFEQYQGVSVIATKPNAENSLAGAVFGKFALFANDPRVIRNAINDLQVPELSLSSLSDYQQGIERLEASPINLSFVNASDLGAWGQQFLPANLNLGSADFAKDFRGGITIGLGLTNDGLRAETILSLDQPTKFSTVSAHDLQVAKFVSGGISHLAGYDLNRTWQELKQTLEVYPSVTAAFNQMTAQLDGRVGVKFEQDILPWLNGAYALGLSFTNPLSPDWLLAVENREGVDAAITHLDQVAHEQAKLTVGEVTVRGQTLTVWTKLEAMGKSSANLTGSVVTVHTKTPEYTLLGSSVDAIYQALTPKIKKQSNNSNQSGVSIDLPSGAEGYAYIDRQFPLPLSLPTQIKSLSLIAIAPQKEDPATIKRGQILIELGKK
jgi:Protein of unknown function (DUF3352)